MLLLTEQDYLDFSPLAREIFSRKFQTPYLVESMRTRVGSRALVEMLFLEDSGVTHDILDQLRVILVNIFNRSSEDDQWRKKYVMPLMRQVNKLQYLLKNNDKSFAKEFYKLLSGLRVLVKTKRNVITDKDKEFIKNNFFNMKGWDQFKSFVHEIYYKLSDPIKSKVKELYTWGQTHKIPATFMIIIFVITLGSLLIPKIRDKIINFVKNTVWYNIKKVLSFLKKIFDKIVV